MRHAWWAYAHVGRSAALFRINALNLKAFTWRTRETSEGTCKRSTGHQRSMQHRTLSLANCEAVRACMIAELGDEEGQLAAALEVDAKVCVECWPAESLQLINDVLDARVAFLREDGLVFGSCAGLRIPGSWKRPHGQCGGRGAYLADIIKAPPDGVKLFEVQLDGADYYELHSFDECRAARRLHDAVDAVVRTDVEKERKRVHKVADGKRKRVCTENLAQLNVLGGALTDNEAELAAALNEIASLKAIGPDSTFTLGHFTREFFMMKVNTSLFLSMTGFDDWDMAQVPRRTRRPRARASAATARPCTRPRSRGPKGLRTPFGVVVRRGALAPPTPSPRRTVARHTPSPRRAHAGILRHLV